MPDKPIIDESARAQLSAMWKRIDEQTNLANAISNLTTEVKVMNVTVQNSVEVQKELKDELLLHRAKLDDIEKLKYEFAGKINATIDEREAAFDERIKTLEFFPGKQAVENREYLKRHLITVIITGVIVFIGSVIANMIVDYKIQEKYEKDRSTERKNQVGVEASQ